MASKKGAAPTKQLTKTQLIQAITDATTEVSRKQVKDVLEALADIGHKQLKKSAAFTLPGFAKFRVIKKPATKERRGKNPFTGADTVFKAKPARKVVKARPVKAIKDAVA
jgi:nucleoid DNA-binding protein